MCYVGVPVFSVVIKNSLVAGGICSPDWALFWGSVFPYLLAWMLYQGTYLIALLNWTGLLVNGLVAFVLPLVLTLEATYVRHKCYHFASEYNKSIRTSNVLQEDTSDPLDALNFERSLLYCDGPDTEQPDVIELVKSEAMSHVSSSSLAAPEVGRLSFETDRLLSNLAISSSGGTFPKSREIPCLILEQLRKQEYCNSVNALPAFLIPFRFELVIFVQLSFVCIVIWSIVNGS